MPANFFWIYPTESNHFNREWNCVRLLTFHTHNFHVMDTYSVIAVKPCNGMIPQTMPIMMPNTCRDQ